MSRKRRRSAGPSLIRRRSSGENSTPVTWPISSPERPISEPLTRILRRPAAGNGDLHRVRSVAALGFHGDAAEFLAPADQFAILPRAMRAPRAAQIDGLEQVRFALRVVSGQHRNARAGPELRARVVAVVGKREGQYAHGAPFQERPAPEGGAMIKHAIAIIALEDSRWSRFRFPRRICRTFRKRRIPARGSGPKGLHAAAGGGFRR